MNGSAAKNAGTHWYEPQPAAPAKALAGTSQMNLYWRAFSFLVRRVVASAFSVGGLIIAVLNAPGLLPGGTINVDGSPSTDIVIRLISGAMPLLISALGLALYRAKPFTPSEQHHVRS